MIGLESHFFQAWFVPLRVLKFRCENLYVLVLFIILNQNVHVIVDFLNQILEQFRMHKFFKSARNHQCRILRFLLQHF
jgi:hypothetical protein